ncbi:ArnT family glycosyltransferase [Croceicoccus mobilis]|nr:glycosyltransferase family 39 protein [Croceicoccus mobilis]
MANSFRPLKLRQLRQLWGVNDANWGWAGLSLLLLVQGWLVFNKPLHWDEFFYYLEVDRFARGHLHRALQTFHVRLFAWLPTLFENNVDAIVVGRIFMLVCEFVTLLAIHGIARRFASRGAALLAVLLYISASYVFLNGFSFRTDPIATAALMSALYLLSRPECLKIRLWVMAAIAGGLTGFAAIITIKSVLYATAFAGIAYWRWRTAERPVRDLQIMFASGFFAIACFILLYIWHAQGVPQLPEARSSSEIAASSAGISHANRTSFSTLRDAASRMFFIGKPHNLALIITGFLTSPALIALVPMTGWALATRRTFQNGERLALLGLWLPVTTLIFYENTAPYFFVFMLAPVCCACAISLDDISRRVPLAFVTIGLVALLIPSIATQNPAIIRNQHQLVDTAHRLFPERVAYFDHAGMIGGFDKMNNFMTPWGMKKYRADKVPIYRRAMESKAVPLLLLNWWLFSFLDDPDDSTFLKEDADALRENYIKIAGAIWVAGRNAKAGNPPLTSEFLVPGPYTVLGAPVLFDGIQRAPGEVFEISRGKHVFSAIGNKDARLVWGRNPDLPEAGSLPLLIWPRS